MLRIIDNKAVDLTDKEWEMYQAICVSYDNPPTQRGKDLFVDLFETDEQGMILFLKPPKHQISLEIWFFVMSLLQSQQLRRAQNKVDEMCARVENKLEGLNKKVKQKTNK